MSQQDKSIDVSGEVQRKLGTLLWENIVLHAQLKQAQARIAELELQDVVMETMGAE